MKQDGIGRETNHKRLLISQNKLRVVGGRGIAGSVVGLWTLGRVCAMVSAVKCVSLMIHRPVLLGQIIHYMLIKQLSTKPMSSLVTLPRLRYLTHQLCSLEMEGTGVCGIIYNFLF